MAKIKVVLLCGRSLLGESLEQVLGKLEDVELIALSEPDSTLPTRLAELQPDVVLIAEEKNSRGQTSLTARILESCPTLPVVRVGLEQNIARVFTSHTLPARSAELVDAIRRLSSHRLDQTQ